MALKSGKNCVLDSWNKLCKIKWVCRNLQIAGSEDTNLFSNNSVTSNYIYDIFIYRPRKKALESGEKCVLDHEYKLCKVTCVCRDLPIAGSEDTNLFSNNSANSNGKYNLFNWLNVRHLYLSTSKKALKSDKNCVLDSENKLCKVKCICRDLQIAGPEDTNFFSINSVTSNGKLNLFNWLYFKHPYLSTSKKALKPGKNCVLDS